MDEAELGGRLSTRLTYLLKQALLKLDELHAEQLAPFGVNVRELAVLLLLDDLEPESQQEVARRLGVDRTTMVGLLDSLEGKRFIVRRPDAEDRRRNVIEITDRGRAELQGATEASDSAERRLLAGLDEQDSRRLRALLRRVGADHPGR